MILDHPIFHKQPQASRKNVLMDYITTLSLQGHVGLPVTGTSQSNNLNDNIMRLSVGDMKSVFDLIAGSQRKILCFVLLQSLDFNSAMTYIDFAMFKAHREEQTEYYKEQYRQSLNVHKAFADAKIAHAEEMERQCHKKLGRMQRKINDMKVDNRVMKYRIKVLSEMAQHWESKASKLKAQVVSMKAKWNALLD